MVGCVWPMRRAAAPKVPLPRYRKEDGQIAPLKASHVDPIHFVWKMCENYNRHAVSSMPNILPQGDETMNRSNQTMKVALVETADGPSGD